MTDLKTTLDKLAVLAAEDADVQEAFDNLVYDLYGMGKAASALNNSGGEEQLAAFRSLGYSYEDIFDNLVKHFDGSREQLLELAEGT